MCFSADASFAAASVLSVIGFWSIGSTKPTRLLPLAAIPLVFAAQQVSEGALWLVLDHAAFGKSDTIVARFFLFFALFVWPVYVPLALFVAEQEPTRRRALSVFCVLGGVVGSYLMGCASLRKSDACIAYDNLYYWVQFDAAAKPLVPYVYVACVASPLLISSLRGTSFLALATLISFATTGYLYRAGFVSVWCFFAAILSAMVAIVAKSADRFVMHAESASRAGQSSS